MDAMLYAVLPILGGLLLFAIISLAVKSPARRLQQNFVKLGNMTGMTYAEISAAVGPANTDSPQVGADGEQVTVKQWIKPGYHIALIFDKDNRCIGKTHEAAV